MNRLPLESAQPKTKMLPLAKMAVSHSQMKLYAAEVKNSYLQLKTLDLAKDETLTPPSSDVVAAIRKSKQVVPKAAEKEVQEVLPPLPKPRKRFKQPDFWLPVTVLIPEMPQLVQNEAGQWIPSIKESQSAEYQKINRLITKLQKLPGPVERLQFLVEKGLAEERELTSAEEKLLKLEIETSDDEKVFNIPQHTYWRTLQAIFPEELPNLNFNPDNEIKWDLPEKKYIKKDPRLPDFHKLAICNNYENNNIFLFALEKRGYITEKQRIRHRNPFYEDTPFKKERYLEPFKGEVVSLRRPSLEKKSILKSTASKETVATSQANAIKARKKLRFDLANTENKLSKNTED